METIVGIAIKASIIEPDRAVNPVGKMKDIFYQGTSVTIPMKPSTTLE